MVRCHSLHGIYATNTTFYRNGAVLQFSVTNDNLEFTNVDHNMAGTYRCTKQIYYNEKFQLYCAETYISVEGKIVRLGEFVSWYRFWLLNYLVSW